MTFGTVWALLLASRSDYAELRVVDSTTGRGVPLIELRTVNHLRFITDSAGRVAFREPGLMDRDVWFHIEGPGYAISADGFRYRGVRIRPQTGKTSIVKVDRVNIAERICRLTGQGIYRDTILLGQTAPIANPVMNDGVMGQDTAQAEIYRGRMMWFWGDTDRPDYPLGNFHTTGAVAKIPAGGADNGIEYRYFSHDGAVRPMVESAESNPIWISGLAVLGSGTKESLYAYYAQMINLGAIKSRGYLKWNDAAERFDIVQTFPPDRGWRYLDGHTVREGKWVLANNPPTVRVPATEDSLRDARAYEAYTCLDAQGQVQRIGGRPDYRWQRDLPPISSEIEARLVREGKLNPDETHFLPLDPEGKPVEIAAGSVHWNAYRKRWIGIFGRKGGRESFLGEIVYAEADAPTGPFRRAVTICDHPRYSFYNPVHHAFLDSGPVIYFEGTYTAEFSGNPSPTPLYNYNQLLYRLTLTDPRLKFAQSPVTEGRALLRENSALPIGRPGLGVRRAVDANRRR